MVQSWQLFDSPMPQMQNSQSSCARHVPRALTMDHLHADQNFTGKRINRTTSAAHLLSLVPIWPAQTMYHTAFQKFIEKWINRE